LVREQGWRILNVDVSVIAERPRILPRRDAIRRVIADALGLEIDRVSVKATTNEGLGAIGRGEGVSAFAVATLVRPFGG
jgi:2-C-methyl-D-erythritol 4-phosphate cytidylyltransferase/2-C-methyl-D-erythritol 2,4-cyclodiphosphate synthase